MNDFDATKHPWAPLVPELNVRDIAQSLHFWCELLGFAKLYDRLDEGFAYLERELARAGWPLFLAPTERWYRTGNKESGQRQFLVQDPDGYLLRFAESSGERAVRR